MSFSHFHASARVVRSQAQSLMPRMQRLPGLGSVDPKVRQASQLGPAIAGNPSKYLTREGIGPGEVNRGHKRGGF